MEQLCFTCGKVQKAKGTKIKWVCEKCNTIHYIPVKASSILIKTQAPKKGLKCEKNKRKH
jgi:NADH pyrophosphatase NudC (nudix superfamily)